MEKNHWNGKLWYAYGTSMTSIEAGKFVPVVEELIARTPYDAPKFILDPEVTDFYAFTPASVKLEGYQAHPLDQKIPVAV